MPAGPSHQQHCHYDTVTGWGISHAVRRQWGRGKNLLLEPASITAVTACCFHNSTHLVRCAKCTPMWVHTSVTWTSRIRVRRAARRGLLVLVCFKIAIRCALKALLRKLRLSTLCGRSEVRICSVVRVLSHACLVLLPPRMSGQDSSLEKCRHSE